MGHEGCSQVRPAYHTACLAAQDAQRCPHRAAQASHRVQDERRERSMPMAKFQGGRLLPVIHRRAAPAGSDICEA
ncbi:hypothetical protein D7X12_13030 [Corallococcus sicarius]|uniref:Uncharacterized protein n=1 Tax=Corallococcus sicarius TaxID=2316726 RepID=A0A3A8NGQ2_9BACT|nr:hypothetical protein D7X12_13030 [Corallococcus sicarius]